MKTRLFICSLLIVILSFVLAIPAFAHPARAYASILIIIPPRAEEAKDKIEQESILPQGKQILAEEDANLIGEKE
ncbi:MAG: hypothetical protein ISS44_04735 [Candidatus Omnitrophica bacterium]|nr:hypothetical protein [Candidatus Aminicenantes bacterium]MBL7081849.1 hypothetical protein [Candidatus Omnitrophota bacterium]